MKDNGKIIKDMVKVLLIIRMVANMMVIGLMVIDTDMECFTMKMVISMKLNLEITN
jgi:hypothetical protein